jgi:hypothetical protein
MDSGAASLDEVAKKRLALRSVRITGMVERVTLLTAV